MLTVLEIIKKTTGFLDGKGVESPRLQAELILGHVLGLKRMQLYLQFERPLTEPELEKIRPLVRRRSQREPLQYVLGETEFCGLRLKVDRRALIPRPETEMLVELLTSLLVNSPPTRALDLGLGSGAITLALAQAFPASRVTGIDISEEALALARENVSASGFGERVTLLRSDWFAQIESGNCFDLIVANPPYLTTGEVTDTTPEVRDFEPRSALIASDNGLSDLRAIIAAAPRFLSPGGLLALETGIAHHPTLLELLGADAWSRAESHRDLTGRNRFVLAWRGAK